MVAMFFNHPVAAAFIVSGASITVAVLALEWETVTGWFR